MNAKLSLSSYYILFFVCVTLELQNAYAQIDAMTLTTNDPTKQCTAEYTYCKLKTDDNLLLQRGEKGEEGKRGAAGLPGVTGPKGEPGLPGLKGASGINGERGEAGLPGMPGYKGPKGDRGENGDMGLRGPPGDKGDIGPSGIPGTNGLNGLAGKQGETGRPGPEGKPGPVGPPGSPGRHGVCPCFGTPNAPDSTEGGEDIFGTEDWPAEVPCKSAPDKTESGMYYLGPTGKPMTVYCNMTTLETCITNKTTSEINHDSSKGAFWLHEENVHMLDLFKSISAEQLIWLRDRSDTVRQTLKYHCLDSVPYVRYNMSASVKLWAWNDAVIGPYPTDQSPIFYSVPEATDKCVEGNTKWSSTIIELQSYNTERLPITDIWIGDIRHAGQKMFIESVELCFG